MLSSELRAPVTEDAEQDLEDIYDYISASGSPQNADYILDRLLEVTENLTTFPERGSQQKELRLLGFKEYRQAFFNSYRTIYRVIGEQVVVYVIADGRHDMQTLLSRRLFGR
jgi:toxin ParE1/3/4